MVIPTRQNHAVGDILILLPKVSDHDSDIRFMSLADLCNILKNAAPTLLLNEYSTAAKIMDSILKALDDRNGDVQSQALACVGPLAAKAPTELLSPFMEKLTNLEVASSLDNSMPATATRMLVLSLPRPLPGMPLAKPIKDAYISISKVLIPRLLGYVVFSRGLKDLPDPPRGMLETSSDKGVDIDAIDLLSEVVRCFGPMLRDEEKQALQKKLVDILDDPRTGKVSKKKAVAALSILTIHLTDPLLSTFVSDMIESFRNPHLTHEKRRLLISLIGSVALSIPRRLGQYLKTIAPFILSALSQQEYQESSEDMDEDGAVNPALEEVKEAALITLEDFLSSCSNEMRLFTDEAIAAALRYVAYDPYLASREDDDEMSGTQIDNEDENEDNALDPDNGFEEEAAMSDGDDASWKIRRCAAKVLYTIISTRGTGDLLENGTLYEKIAPVLIKSFVEREENVRLEILATLGALLRKTTALVPATITAIESGGSVSMSQTPNSRKRRRVASTSSMSDNQDPVASQLGMASPTESPSPVSGPHADLARLGHAIVRGVVKLLKQDSELTKQATITLLRDLVAAQRGGLNEHIESIIDPIIDAIKRPNVLNDEHTLSATGIASTTGSSLRIESILLLREIYDTHSSRVVAPYMGKIIPTLIEAIQDNYFKISCEAIRAIESVVKVLAPPRALGTEAQLKMYVEEIFEAVAEKAKVNSTDLEVRQRALHALGIILARTSSADSEKLLSVSSRLNAMEIIHERLKNETTRVASVQSIDTIVSSPISKDNITKEWVRSVTLELANQLRKSDRILRASSLGALKHLVENPVILRSFDAQTVKSLIKLLLPLITPNNRSLLGPSLGVLTCLVRQNPTQVVDDNFNKALCGIIVIPLGGNALEELLGLVDAVGARGVGQRLMQGLLKDVGVFGDPAVVGSAIGALLVSGGSKVGVSINDIVDELRTAHDDQRKCLALSVLGEACLRLGSSSPLQPSDFFAHFESKSDQVPRAAAVALGRAGAGNVSIFLPFILSKMDTPGSSQLLLLHSVKEILQHVSRIQTNLSAYTEEIWKHLLKVSEVEDNKAIGAECVGRLISIEPKRYLHLFQVSLCPWLSE